MANQNDFIVKYGLVVESTTTISSTNNLVTTNIVRPPAKPSLDLNFTRSASLDPRISFIRASGASYFNASGSIQMAGLNQPRFNYDPITGQCLGLLTEPSRTNLISNSTGFISLYATGNVVTSTNEISALHINSTVNKHTRNPSSTGDNNVGYYGISLSSGTMYTASAYVWIPSATTVTSVGITADNTSYTQVNADLTKRNQWQQIYTTASTTATVGNAFVLRPNGMVNGGYIYSTCWQVESVSSYPTSYIPTSGATVTRAADQITITGQNFNNFYTQGQGTLFIETYLPGPRTAQSGFMAALYRSSTDYIGMQYIAAVGWYTGTNYCSFNGTAIQTDTVAGANANYNRINKTAVTYDSTGFTAVHDGATYFTPAGSFVGIPLVTQLSLGGRAGSGSDFAGQGSIRKVTYWPQKLSTATLQMITGIV